MSHALDVDGDQINLRYVVSLAAAAALGGLLFGFDIAIITGAGPFLTRQFHLNDFSLGVAFSSLLFGCVLGAALAGRITDRLGRRKVLLWVAVVFAITSAATALASSFFSFTVARFLGGIAVGGASILSPMYVAEVSPAPVRGRLGALYQFSIILGILLSYAINYLLRNSGPANWRWMFATGALPALLFFILLMRAPETPRFLVKAGREPEALAVLKKIGGDATAALHVSEIRASLAGRRDRWRDLNHPAIRRAVIVSFFLAILIHFSGINTVIDYAPAIFQAAGWKIDAALFSTLIVGVTNFAFTVLSFWMIDRFGRKPLYIVGSCGMALALLCLTAASWTGYFRGTIVLVLVLTYLACFASCIGPVFWTLVPEIFPNHVRGLAMTVPVLTQWIANAVVVLLFPTAFHQVGKSATFAFLAVMALLQAVFTWRFLPETRGKSLEAIEAHWESAARRV